MTEPDIDQVHMEALARLVFQGGSAKPASLGDLTRLVDVSHLGGLRDLADKHHVVIRAFDLLRRLAVEAGNNQLAEWCRSVTIPEEDRVTKALAGLEVVCQTLETAGCPTVVIKSLDHWPDLGSDLDLYTSASPTQVVRVLTEQLQAAAIERSWGDRLANKWNFQIPGLSELVEIHVRYLGQTGEQAALATRVVRRRVSKQLQGRTFLVAAPEERVLISTLQRMYRHFYFRLCDMIDFADLLLSKSVDYDELRAAAKQGGIWPGTATFLLLVARYAEQYGCEIPLPAFVTASAYSQHIRVKFNSGFLRVPMGPAARLYGAQLLDASKHLDLRAMMRLPLLPPLAVSALVAHRVTGSDKGIW